MKFLIIVLSLLITPIYAQSIPHAYLSGSSDPKATINTPFSILHYSNGINVDLILNISNYAIGAYDIFEVGGVLSSAIFNPIRSMTNYIGSINISVAGQLTTRNDPCFACKWEIYNAYNQRHITMMVITQELNMSYCPSNPYSVMQPFNNNPNNSGSIFTGLKETVTAFYQQRSFDNSTLGAYGILNGIGWDSNSIVSGTWGGGTHDDINYAGYASLIAHMVQKDVIGLHTATMLIGAAKNSSGCPQNQVNSANTSGVNYTTDDQGHLIIEWNG
jgi:hypothetical protein